MNGIPLHITGLARSPFSVWPVGWELGFAGPELPAQPGLPAAEQGHFLGMLEIQPCQGNYSNLRQCQASGM